MGAYIIHFDDKPWQDLDDEQYYRCSEIPWFSTSKTTISRLTPHTEPDTDTIRKEAYDEGYREGMQLSIGEAEQREAYQRGLNDAWECAKRINGAVTNGGMHFSELHAVFGTRYPENIMDKFSASEAIERLRA